MLNGLNYKLAFRWFLVLFIAISGPIILNYIQFYSSEWFTFKHFLKYEIVILVFSYLISIPIIIKHKIASIYLKLVAIIVIGYSGLEFWHVFEFQGFPNSATFFSIFTTSLNESWSFIENQFDWIDFVLVLLFWLVLLGVYFLIKKGDLHKLSSKTEGKLCVFGLVVILSGYGFIGPDRLLPSSLSDTSILSGANAYFDFLYEQEEFQKLSDFNPEFEGFSFVPVENEVHVIIIGESTSRHHMGLYDYWRETNPRLSEVENLIAFSQVTSPHAHTVPSLTKALTFKSNSNPDIGMEHGTLIDLLNQADYETYWISNQAIAGDFETPISYFANKTDHKIFSNSSRGTEQYDEVLLNPFNDILKKPGRKVIFVHLMGSHMSYSDRYPESFETFKGAKQDNFWNESQINYVNNYDNSVLYNDHIIAEFISSLNSSKEHLQSSASLIYFSDHGDEVFDYRDFHGHSDVNKSKYMTDIPFIFWSNKTYQESHKEAIKYAKLNLNAPSNLDVFIASTGSLYGFNCNKIDPGNGLFSSQIKNQLDTNLLPELRTKNDLDFPTKILCHRVNGIDRLHEVKDHFDGFEIDLMYSESGVYDVNHLPEKSIGLNLEELIGSLDEPSEYYYWLDVKNLDSSNAQQAANRLLEVCSSGAYLPNIVIESRSLYSLSLFDKLGFKTSLYLPAFQKYTEENITSSIDSLALLFAHFAPSVISQEYGVYPILNTYFPECDKLTWDLQYDWKIEKDQADLRSILTKDNRLQLILVRYETPSYR